MSLYYVGYASWYENSSLSELLGDVSKAGRACKHFVTQVLLIDVLSLAGEYRRLEDHVRNSFLELTEHPAQLLRVFCLDESDFGPRSYEFLFRIFGDADSVLTEKH